ncbi:unnamed protein product [Arabidopsis thaliana]|uniref:Uncharacterized protein n=1 Tax=Arabidopsis thaliana TaxID=3702 RepID=A0A654EXH7_ARATH|nr:unnamed protein product [Arabidopsis thaliana]
MCGGAWIVRDIGQAKHHARDAFMPIQDRTGAALHSTVVESISRYSRLLGDNRVGISSRS